MCGILAFAGSGLSPQTLESALDVMAHRGPDSRGTWTDGVAWLGHRRLKIIDLSANAAQPMPNEDQTIFVTFNGEIYNFIELRAELESKGHHFRSNSDTEVIVHGYEEWGDDCVSYFWGMFAFVIWDTRRQRLFVARDRFGKKPVNYVCHGNSLLVASEIPAILATGFSERRINLDAIGLFWAQNYISAPHTAFTDISKLPAGHAMVFERGTLRQWRYYPPREVAPFTGTRDEARAQLHTLLLDATRRRLVSDVPVGITLSGGIDSTIIAMLARELIPGRLVTLTVRPHLKNNRHDEGDFARTTAKLLDTEHHEIEPQPVLLDSLGKIIQNLGEPFAIASAIPSFYLFQALREKITVILSGDGGDEHFGGYRAYRYASLRNLLKRFQRTWNALYAAGNALYGLIPPTRPALKSGLAALQFAAGKPPSEAHWEMNRVLRPNVAAVLLRGATRLHPEAALATIFAERQATRRAMLCDQFDWMAYHVLTKVDIASMAHGVEVRSPLLDHRVAELARSLPLSWLIHGKNGKQILREILSKGWPKEFVDRPKTGFGLPIREVFATTGFKYLKDVLMSQHSVYEEFVNRDAILDLLESHKAGRPYQTGLLLKLLVLRLWIEYTNCTIK